MVAMRRNDSWLSGGALYAAPGCARLMSRRSYMVCALRIRDLPLMRPNLSLNPDASPAVLARRPLGAG